MNSEADERDFKAGYLLGCSHGRDQAEGSGYAAGMEAGGALVNERYVAAMLELNRYRDMLDKVKPEDLCSTVQEREAMLKNQAALSHQATKRLQANIDRAVSFLTSERESATEPQYRVNLTRTIYLLTGEDRNERNKDAS